MKTQLILLNEPVIVSDELRKIGDFYVGEGFGGLNSFKWTESQEQHYPNQKGKIIAGFLMLPSINWNNLEDEFGYVDVDKLAEHSSEIQEGTYTLQHKITYKHGYLDGFEAAQQIKRFSLEDVFNSIGLAIGLYSPTYASFEEDWKEKIIQSLSQPKVFSIEIEMEKQICACAFEQEKDICIYPECLRPKITNNQIKILRKL